MAKPDRRRRAGAEARGKDEAERKPGGMFCGSLVFVYWLPLVIDCHLICAICAVRADLTSNAAIATHRTRHAVHATPLFSLSPTSAPPSLSACLWSLCLSVSLSLCHTHTHTHTHTHPQARRNMTRSTAPQSRTKTGLRSTRAASSWERAARGGKRCRRYRHGWRRRCMRCGGLPAPGGAFRRDDDWTTALRIGQGGGGVATGEERDQSPRSRPRRRGGTKKSRRGVGGRGSLLD